VHVVDTRLIAQRRFDALGDIVGLADSHVRGELEVQGDADVTVVLVDGDVVRLAHQRLGERDRERAVAQVRLGAVGELADRLGDDEDPPPARTAPSPSAPRFSARR
jgi:hypothetical protein